MNDVQENKFKNDQSKMTRGTISLKVPDMIHNIIPPIVSNPLWFWYQKFSQRGHHTK